MHPIRDYVRATRSCFINIYHVVCFCSINVMFVICFISCTFDICFNHGGRIVTSNILYDHWGGEEHMICNVKTRHFGIHTVKSVIGQQLSQYNDVIAYYFRVPTVQMCKDFSLQKIEHEFVLTSFVEQIEIGDVLDIYLVHSRIQHLSTQALDDGYKEGGKKWIYYWTFRSKTPQV